ncbi:MAG TPA: hypothetical protein VFY90_01090, partial [Tepidiformaceae bacterium]|nr:hypothetical protein [Tepidiformaceae bacterium]
MALADLEERGDPDAGLTPEERLAKHAALRTESDMLRAQFLEDFQRSGTDPRRLERVPIDVDYDVPASSLQQAISDAEIVVLGRVKSVEFRYEGNGIIVNYLTVDVEQTFKGTRSSGTITVAQLGGPEQIFHGDGSQHTVLAETPGDPLLFEGDEAFLLLVPAQAQGIFQSSGPFVSQYRVDGGQLRAVDGNPFGLTIERQSPAEFEAALSSLSRP